MDDLPQELVDRISGFLEHEDLKRTLFVSRKFQLAAEQLSGAFSNYEMIPDTASTSSFISIYCGRRFPLLQCLQFRTHFPALTSGMDALPCRYPKDMLLEMDKHFTRQIIMLFTTMHTLEDSLGPYAKNTGAGKIKLCIYTPTRTIDQDAYCWHHTFLSWRIRLLFPESLPEVRLIRALKIENGGNLSPFNGYRQLPAVYKLDHRIILDIAKKLPHLHHLECAVGGDEIPSPLIGESERAIVHDLEGPRRDSRRNFAESLGSDAIPPLHSLALNFMHPISTWQAIDQRNAMPNMVAPGTYDLFSTNLRMASQNLRRLVLHGVFDETLFWPRGEAQKAPSWPNLEHFSVMFHISAPSGKWYFKGLHDEGATEGFDVMDDHYPPFETTEDDTRRDAQYDYMQWDETVCAQYRVLPNEKTLRPFLKAFATAASSSMPSLKQAALWTPLNLNAIDVDGFYEEYEDEDEDGGADELANYPGRRLQNLAWGMAYAAPREEAFFGFDAPSEQRNSQARQIWWEIGDKWRPDRDLQGLFQRIGRKEHGERLIEYWEHEYYGSGLIDRRHFEEFEERLFGLPGLS